MKRYPYTYSNSTVNQKATILNIFVFYKYNFRNFTKKIIESYLRQYFMDISVKNNVNSKISLMMAVCCNFYTLQKFLKKR